MQWIDTHTHIYLENFDLDRDEIIQEAQDLGFCALLLPNIDIESLSLVKSVCEKYPTICMPMVGLHPCDVKDDFQYQLATLKNIWEDKQAYFTKNKIVAIGEIGLDYYWDISYREEQKLAFRTQIEWALSANLPIVIHTRDAIDDAIAIVSEYISSGLKGVFHCFSGNEYQAEAIINMGFLLGIGGVLTYKKSTLAEAIANIPLKSIILETDAPFLPPVPYRGKRNEPKYMLEVAKKLAILRNEDMATIAAITTANAKELFHLQ
jgi:TatD DNase family protein